MNINIHILRSCAESVHEGYTTNISEIQFLRTNANKIHTFDERENGYVYFLEEYTLEIIRDNNSVLWLQAWITLDHRAGATICPGIMSGKQLKASFLISAS